MYWITGLLGIASIIAPYLFGFTADGTAFLTSIIIGASLVAVSGIEWLSRDRDVWEYWVAGIVGIAAAASPFVLGFAGNTAAVWTVMAVGIFAFLAASYRVLAPPTTYQG